METSTIANIGWLLLLTLMVFMGVYITINIIRNERKRKSFKPTMKSGDEVYFPVASNSMSGEIIDVDGDTVTIKVKVSKERVYPKN